jgi:hypothetical protein
MSIYNVLMGSSGPFLFIRTISSNQVDYNLNTALTAAGWNGLTPIIANITIASAVQFTASANTIPAFTVGTLPTGSSVYITNNGYIVGRGGRGVGKGFPTSTSYNLTAPATANGGVALSVSSLVSIDNAGGTIGGGGGGGGAGGGTSGDCACSGCGGVSLNGLGVGGSGAGFGAGGSGYSTWQNFSQYFNSISTSAGGLTTASTKNGTGGTGGTLGVAGGTGTGSVPCSGYTNESSPGTGGAAGACTSGNSNITWINTGTRLGTLG